MNGDHVNRNNERIRLWARLVTGALVVMLTFAAVSETGHCEDAGAASQSQTTERIPPALNTSGALNRQLAVDPIRDSDGFSAVLYNNRNGLPTSDANAIAQTRDGFLWIGSYSGLIRYDGNNFERLYLADGIANVRCLFVDSKDRLWAGTNDSGVFSLSKGMIESWDKSDGLGSNSVRAVVEASDGCIYVSCAAGGISMIRKDGELARISDERIDNQTIHELRRGSDGLIYGVTQEGDIIILRNGGQLSFFSHDDIQTERVLCIMPDPVSPGSIYLGTSDSMIIHGDLTDRFVKRKESSIEPLTYITCMEYIDGQIWICADNGIGCLGEDGLRQLSGVPMNNSVESVLTDYEGNLWFVSNHQGVMKIVSNPFSDLFKRYELPEAVVNSTCYYEDRLFIGTDTGLIVMEGDKRLRHLTIMSIRTASGKRMHDTDLIKFLEGVRVRGMYRDSRDRLWIPAWHKYGLLCYDHGEVIVFCEEDGMFSDAVRTVTELSDGSIVAGGNGGACIIENNRVTKSFGAEDGVVNQTILTAMEGFHGEIILGSDGDGIYCIGPEGTEHIGLEEGLHSEIVLRIKKSAKRDVIWIATGNSMAYMTPDHKVTTIQNYPYPNNYDMYENSKGDLWILASAGIYVIPCDELLANGQIEPTFYGIQSGVPCAASANASSELTPEGDLYIAGSSGVIKVNIDKTVKNAVSLKIALPYIDADEVRIYPDEYGHFLLPANARKVTIYPYVFNYSLVEPLVTYELEGFDLPATTTTRDKLKPIDYTNLKIGKYIFVMNVRDSAGDTEQTQTFTIVKGRELSVGTIGTMILDGAAILLLSGIIIFTSVYRRRGRITDRLYFAMIISAISLAASEFLSYRIETVTAPLMHALMIFTNTLYYAALVFLPYLLTVYLACRITSDKKRLRKWKLLSGIPCILYLAAVLINLRTGWIFTIDAGNVFHPGSERMQLCYQLPAGFYLLLMLIMAFKVSKRMFVSFTLLLLIRYAGFNSAWMISSTSFEYAMFLAVIHLCVLGKPIKGEEI